MADVIQNRVLLTSSLVTPLEDSEGNARVWFIIPSTAGRDEILMFPRQKVKDGDGVEIKISYLTCKRYLVAKIDINFRRFNSSSLYYHVIELS